MSDDITSGHPDQRQATFLRKMAHEMRTPLGSMLMLAELLADNAAGRLGEREVDYARKIQRAGAEISGLLQAVLDLSRIETGAVAAERAGLAMAELAEDLRRLAGEASNELEVELSSGLPEKLAIDRLQLKRLLGLLIAHAGRAGGGRVVCRLCAGDEATVEIALAHGGAPIPDERRAAAFEPFQPGQRGAAGLALPTAKALAGLLEGRLELNAAGDGFVLRLPVS